MEPTNRLSLLLLSILLALVAVFLAPVLLKRRLSNEPPSWLPEWRSLVVLSPETVAAADGRGGGPTHLVVLGEVYDVGDAEFYKESGGYRVFVGKDATLAFVTGDFAGEKGIPLDDVSSLNAAQMGSLHEWVDFYRKHEKYKFAGVLRGRYYDEEGRRTQAWRDAYAKMGTAKEFAKEEERLEKMFPSCSSRWSQNEGSKVWCEMVSAKGRTLLGKWVPRRFKSKSPGARVGERCACVDSGAKFSDEFSVYEGCSEDSTECKLKDPEVS